MPANITISPGLQETISSTSGPMRLISGGREYFDLLLQLINQAVDSIHLQTYIFNDDETGTLVANALKQACQRKVQVYLVADGYASQALHRRFIAELKEAGIHFRFFEPLFRSRHFYFGRRMHHKVMVVDAKYAMVGGINIANRYNDIEDQKAWLDFALYVEGDIARDLCLLCWKTWNGFRPNMAKTPCERLTDTTTNADPTIVMRRNDWVRGKNQVSKSYLRLLRNAESHVVILCSYFLPGKVIRRNIVQAIKRGVTVSVIAAGSSDVMLAKHAERWLYDWLLRNGVKLYEYQKNVLHGKLAVCDDKWMTIGSYNINDISAYASVELNLDVYHAGFAKEVRQKLEQIINTECIPITTEYHSRTKNIFTQFVRWISYQFIRGVFRLFTFYFKRSN